MSLLGRLSPSWALRRAAARQALAEQERLYDMAQPRYSGRYPALSGRGYSGDAVQQHAGSKLVDYARYLDENSDIAIGVLDALCNQVAPVDIEPMVTDASGAPVDAINDRLAELWGQWREAADVTHALPWHDLKLIAARSWLRDGDVFVRLLQGNTRGVEHRSSIPFALQLLEADFCPRDYTDEQKGIVQGVQLNRWGRATAYHLYRRHPGGVLPAIGALQQDTFSVQADQLIQLRYARRLHQVRGVSIFAGVIDRLMSLKHYEESERVAARVAASFAAVITRQPVFGQAARYTSQGDRAFELEPGMVMDELAPGEKLEVVNTNRPNSGLESFRNAMLRAVATGVGSSYSTISKDYSGTYSSQRQEMQESKPAYDRLRQYWIAQFLEPVYAEFVRMVLLMGELPASGFSIEQLTRATYTGATIPWIDPLKEMQANELAVENGFKSRQQVIREMGGIRRSVDDELAADGFEKPAPVAPPMAQEQDEESEDESAAV